MAGMRQGVTGFLTSTSPHHTKTYLGLLANVPMSSAVNVADLDVVVAGQLLTQIRPHGGEVLAMT